MPQRSRRRVAITGLGAVTPLGSNVEETWRNLIEGRSGVARITRFDPADCPVQIAGEVKGFEPSSLFDAKDPRQKELRKMGRFIHFALKAGFEAYRDSGLQSSGLSPERIGVNIGVGMGGLPEIETVHEELRTKGYRRVTPFFIPQVIPNLAAGQLSIALGLQGPNLCITTACASGAHSIGEAWRQIGDGTADAFLAGGAEACVSPLGIGGFAAMRALSTRNDAPSRASRPYDRDRDGFVMGEGGAVLALEEWEIARKRGARIYAEVVGYGLSGDAYHMTTPSPDGSGGYRAMRMALETAGLAPDDIDYVNAHGTSTPAGDVEEARAIAKLIPDASRRPFHVSSTKSMTGHLLGAAGAAEAVFTALAIREGRIPPTINVENLDADCAALGLDFTTRGTVEARVRAALSNSFGFGGTNVCLAFARAEGAG